MTDYPANPLLSPYSKSVTSGYQSACFVLEDTRNQFMKKPLLTSRVWRIWSFAFAAAVVVGTVAMRGLHLNLKPPAIEQIQMTCKLFRSAATTNSRAAKALPVLETILRKALDAQRSNFDITQNQIILDRTGSPAGSTGRPTVIYSDQWPNPSDNASASSVQGSATHDHHPPLWSSQTLPADSILSQPLTRAYEQGPSMDSSSHLVHGSAIPAIKVTTPEITGGSQAHVHTI
ncbi:hypothetical protein MPER_09033 [Moniliophthora perniciosa FA553]|nr:hypothetical protein MPER_09033 [Moniliophthora perniciosa FA553]